MTHRGVCRSSGIGRLLEIIEESAIDKKFSPARRGICGREETPSGKGVANPTRFRREGFLCFVPVMSALPRRGPSLPSS